MFDRRPRGLTRTMPVFLLLAIPYGHRRHPMELEAGRAAGEIP